MLSMKKDNIITRVYEHQIKEMEVAGYAIINEETGAIIDEKITVNKTVIDDLKKQVANLQKELKKYKEAR